MPPDDVADLRVADLLVVDLLGGIGDLVMLLPSLHGLARRHPGAAVRVLTHAPGADAARPRPGRRRGARRAQGRRARGRRRRAGAQAARPRRQHHPLRRHRRGDRATGAAQRHRPVAPPAARRAGGAPLPPHPRRGGARARPLRAAADPPDRRGTGGGPSPVDGAGAGSARRPSCSCPTRAWPSSGGRTRTGSSPSSPGAPCRCWCWAATCHRSTYARWRRCSPRSDGAAAWSSARTPARSGWPPPRGARTVGLFGPTVAARYGLDPPSVDLQGLPGCPHRRPTAITEQVCWWDAACPLAADGPACMADLAPEAVLAAVLDALGGPT